MNFSKLLSSRHSLLRQAHLANLAHSYFTISRLGDRVTNARLTGRVRLRPTSVGEDVVPASLTALSGNQSVIEEHFSDEDVLQLVDSIEFAIESSFTEIDFELDELATTYAPPLREALGCAGVILDEPSMIENNVPPPDRKNSP
jgi:hypothetical protein